jgi:hypothetical protein
MLVMRLPGALVRALGLSSPSAFSGRMADLTEPSMYLSRPPDLSGQWRSSSHHGLRSGSRRSRHAERFAQNAQAFLDVAVLGGQWYQNADD